MIRRLKAGALVAVVAIACCRSFQASGPSRPTEMSAPLAAAEQLLNAMRKRDTTAIRAVVHPTLRVSTAIDASGGSVLSLEGDDFVKVVGRATGPPWNQRLLSPEVRVDGTLATVWFTLSI